jgi:hypothetical protein
MNNTIFYLIGAAGIGKLTIAREIARLTGARVVDSQDVYNPIFNLIEHKHPADMPEAVWAQVDAVRTAILKTIETMSPTNWSFVFTHAGFDIPPDVGVYHTVRETARRRGARFQPVTLRDGKSTRPLLKFDETAAIEIEMAAMSPTDAAKAIVAAGEKG